MRPIDTTNQLDSTADVVTPDVKPQVLNSPASTPPAADQPVETSDPASTAAKRVERDLEAAYFKGQLGKANQGPGVGVLYDKTQHDPAKGGVETKPAIAATSSTLVGKTLGKNQSRVDVKVTRELGSAQGYDERLQAVAAARMAGAEPAAVVLENGKWHALETSAPADGVSNKVDALPSFAQIDGLSKEVTAIKQKLEKEGKTMNAQNRDELTEKLAGDRKKLASLLFGVPESQIQFNRAPRDDNPDKINIDVIDPHRPGDSLGGEHYEGEKPFEPGLRPTFGIKLEELENPKEAAGVLFHEVSHRRDDELAQKWVQKYQQEGHIFVEGAPGRKAFKTWMDDQVKKEAKNVPPGITKADAEMVVDMAENDHATGEARAYVRTALAAVQSGDPELAIQQLKVYAAGIKSGKIASPATGSEVEKALTTELQDAYRQMPPDMQQKLKDAIAAANKANPDAWISHVKLPK